MRRNEPPLKLQESTHVSGLKRKVPHTEGCYPEKQYSNETNKIYSFSGTKVLSQQLGTGGLGYVVSRLIHSFNKYLINSMLDSSEQHKHMKPLHRAYHINGGKEWLVLGLDCTRAREGDSWLGSDPSLIPQIHSKIS